MIGTDHALVLSEAELVSLYLLLSSREADLDSCQQELLSRVSRLLYANLSVNEMEDIDGYYRTLRPSV